MLRFFMITTRFVCVYDALHLTWNINFDNVQKKTKNKALHGPGRLFALVWFVVEFTVDFSSLGTCKKSLKLYLDKLYNKPHQG